MARALALAATLGATIGCYEQSGFVLPFISTVTPASGPNDRATLIEIQGGGFHAVIQGYPGESTRSLDESVAVTLGGIALESARLIGPGVVTAVVPERLLPGHYPISVVVPSGALATLDGAFEVLHAPNDGPDGDPDPPPPPPPPPPVLVRETALTDAGPYSFVFTVEDSVWLGPDSANTVALELDSEAPASPTQHPFAFVRDVTGDNKARNENAATPRSIGKKHCTANSSDCGPDNEDGVSLFGATAMGSETLLVLGGSRATGDLNYVYLARPGLEELTFAYVDLSELLGQQAASVSAMATLDDRLYLGIPDRGGKRPSLVVVRRVPSAGSGLDPLVNGDGPCDLLVHEACDLAASDLPAIGKSADTPLVDALVVFNHRLYVANNGGIARATVADPRDADDFPTDWANATPVAVEHGAHLGVVTDSRTELIPALRTYPALVERNGNLYAARNTNEGPQLWRCDPLTTNDPLDCDAGDWQLVLGNRAAENDATLTQLDDPTNERLTLVASVGDWLYLGFDNPSRGLAIYRTSGADDEIPVRVGEPGFGVATNTRILSNATHAPTESLHLVVGDQTNPARLYRLTP